MAANGRRTEREILPLGMSYSPRTSMFVAWCLLREADRTFEVPWIEALERGGSNFRPRRVQVLREYVALRTAEWKMKEQQARPLPD
jgi:predicted DNA-binding transcriptional regulator YafY